MSPRQNFSEAKDALHAIAHDFDELEKVFEKAISQLCEDARDAELVTRLEKAKAAARQGATIARRRIDGY